MEMNAYESLAMDEARNNLGDAFDYIVYDCHMNLDEFMDLFIISGLAREYENKNPKYVVGMSGTELVWEVFDKVGINHTYLCSTDIVGQKTKEYWSGWILAYYQIMTGKSYKNIMSHLSMQEIENMYHPLHEAPEEKFVEVLSHYMGKQPEQSKLKEYRMDYGITQIELSNRSGVSLRSIQMYEQLRKDIHKASVTTVVNLAKTLGCEVEELLE